MALISQSQRLPPAPAGSTTPVGPLRRLTFPALGTTCEVQYATADAAQAARFETAAKGWVEAFEAKYSRFRPDSLLSRINAAAGKDWVPVDPEMEQMLQLCETLHFMTQGVLDATALPLLRLWNYKANQPVVPSIQQIVDARRLVGWSKVQRAPGRHMALDRIVVANIEALEADARVGRQRDRSRDFVGGAAGGRDLGPGFGKAPGDRGADAAGAAGNQNMASGGGHRVVAPCMEGDSIARWCDSSRFIVVLVTAYQKSAFSLGNAKVSSPEINQKVPRNCPAISGLISVLRTLIAMKFSLTAGISVA